jgi:hypothetical protein
MPDFSIRFSGGNKGLWGGVLNYFWGSKGWIKFMKVLEPELRTFDRTPN